MLERLERSRSATARIQCYTHTGSSFSSFERLATGNAEEETQARTARMSRAMGRREDTPATFEAGCNSVTLLHDSIDSILMRKPTGEQGNFGIRRVHVSEG